MFYNGLENKIINNCLQVKDGETILICGNEFSDKLLENLKREINTLNCKDVILKWSDKKLITLLENSKSIEAAERIMPIKSDKKLHFYHCEVNADRVVIIIPPINRISIFSHMLEELKNFEKNYFSRLFDLQQGAIQGIILDYPFNQATINSLKKEELSLTVRTYRKAIKASFDTIHSINKELFKILEKGSSVFITSPFGTELRLNIKNRYPCEETGEIGFQTSFCQVPGGEIFIAPEERSASGIYYSSINVLGLKCRLEFKDGELKGIKGDNEKEDLKLKQILKHVDISKERLGEFGIGTNQEAMPLKIGSISEKALSTIHIAIGENRNFGGKNESNIHFDFISSKNDVFVDRLKIMEKGKIIL